MTTRAHAFLALLTLAILSCGERAKPQEEHHGSVGGAAVARVGDYALSKDLVRDVARVRGVDPEIVLREMIDDAVLATIARSRGFEEASVVRRAERAALARSVVLRIRTYGQAKGDPTDEEVKQLSIERWQEVDVAESLRVIHAVLLAPKETDPNRDAKMATSRRLANELRNRVLEAQTPEEFEARAKESPPPDGIELKVERLPPFVADGFVTDVGTAARMDRTFTEASFRLKAAGETSEVIETPFGFHVIRLVERIPPRIMPQEERKRLFGSAVFLLRTKGVYGSVLEGQLKRTPIEYASNADELTKRASSEP